MSSPFRVLQALDVLAERCGLCAVPLSIAFWAVSWILIPVWLAWVAVWLMRRHLARDRSLEARTERRVARLLRWYPAAWRARYGDELGALLRDTIADGRDGPYLSADIACEGLAARLAPAERQRTVAVLCGALCWLPLLPQGLIPLVMKVTEVPGRSWFLALYLPGAYAWVTIAAMLGVGLLMLRAARCPVIPTPG